MIITLIVTEAENNPSSSLEASSKESEGVSSSDNPSRNKRMDDFQSQLDALKLKKDSAELGVARPYPVEWDTIPYPPKFKPMSLIQFDGKGSPTHHIYYFLSQTGFIMGNDPIMTQLFIGTLKRVAFEWFRKLESWFIKSWADLEKLFLGRFFL